VIWERDTPVGVATTVTINEVVPQDADFAVDHISAVDEGQGNRTLSGNTVSFRVSGSHGAVATYYNVHVEPPPPPPDTGHVVLCKAGNVAGTFNFNILAVGTVGTDIVKSATSLAAGSCDTVFVRVQAGQAAATITITEDLVANATTFLQGVTVNGAVAATVGAGVVVTANITDDKVVVFTNANATVGATVAYHPNPSPGVVTLCKSANSPAGTFTFHVTGLATVATDQIVSDVTLTAGTCKVIFIRTVPQLVGATLTVTEDLDLLSLIALDHISRLTAGGVLQLKGSLGLVLTENATPGGGSVLLFFNKRITLL
jgi:hypothetical protein